MPIPQPPSWTWIDCIPFRRRPRLVLVSPLSKQHHQLHRRPSCSAYYTEPRSAWRPLPPALNIFCISSFVRSSCSSSAHCRLKSPPGLGRQQPDDRPQGDRNQNIASRLPVRAWIFRGFTGPRRIFGSILDGRQIVSSPIPSHTPKHRIPPIAASGYLIPRTRHLPFVDPNRTGFNLPWCSLPKWPQQFRRRPQRRAHHHLRRECTPPTLPSSAPLVTTGSPTRRANPRDSQIAPRRRNPPQRSTRAPQPATRQSHLPSPHPAARHSRRSALQPWIPFAAPLVLP